MKRYLQNLFLYYKEDSGSSMPPQKAATLTTFFLHVFSHHINTDIASQCNDPEDKLVNSKERQYFLSWSCSHSELWLLSVTMHNQILPHSVSATR